MYEYVHSVKSIGGLGEECVKVHLARIIKALIESNLGENQS